MNELIERAARAIATAEGYAYFPDDEHYNNLARAALLAIREPTPAMLRAGADAMPAVFHGSAVSYAVAVNDAGDMWTAMIDAAMAGEG